MLVAMNANAQWVQMSNGMGNGVIINSIVENGSNIFIGTGNFNGVYFSSNNGSNWIQTSLNNKVIRSLAISGTNIIAGTYYSGIYYSTNNGTNWISTGNVYSQNVYNLITVGNIVFAGTDYGVQISTNNGANWTSTSFNNKMVVCFTSNGNNIFAGTTSSGVYLSTNNGNSWSQTSFNKYTSCLTSIGSNIFAGTDSSVYISTNNGINWSKTTLDNQHVMCIEAKDNKIFACTFENGVFLSTNFGLNWISKNQGFVLPQSISSLLISSSYIFAGSYVTTVWRRSLSEIIGIQNISTETPSKYTLSQNYPNPFNSTSNLKFQIVNTEDVKLIVYDIMGKEVQTLVNERLQPGTYEAAFDASSLNSGVYFYKLITNTFSETKKMILIK